MVRSLSAKFYAFLAVLILALLPKVALADIGSVDVSKLRGLLKNVEDDVKNGRSTAANVAAIWADLAFDHPQAVVPSSAVPSLSKSPFGSTLVALETPSPSPSPSSAAPADGLFSLQIAQTSQRPAEIAALPLPALGKPAMFGATAPSARPGAPIKDPQDVETTNFRLMLGTLAQTYTGLNSMAVVNAQGPRGPVAISVRAGTVTLDDIRSYATAFGLSPLPDGTLTAPVVVWPGATLRLSTGERMALSRDHGAFVLSLGDLDIEGATVEVVGAVNPYTPSFVPFVTVAGDGALSIKRATFRGLGFGETAKFSGVSVARNLLSQGQGKIVIQDSLFDGLQNLTISGVADAEITGNTLINARDNTVKLLNAPRTRIKNNLFAGGSHTNAIRVGSGSGNSLISKNIFLSGHRVAMLINGASDGVVVKKNLVWKRAGAGVKFLNTRCGVVEGNVFLDNRQKGVEVRKSDGTLVRGNLIAGNGSAGIWVSAQKRNARTSVRENVLVGNGSGLSTATAAEILMQGNDFRQQLPRLLDGDISTLSRNVITDLRGSQTMRLMDGRADLGIEMKDPCGSNL